MNSAAETAAVETVDADAISISQAMYFCSCNSNGEKDVELIYSGLTPDRESQLRQFLLRRLRKGAVYKGTGSCSGLDFSIGEGCSTPGVCFYILLPCSSRRKDAASESDENHGRDVIICLLSDSETTLETFQVELTQFCESIAHRILKEGPCPSSVEEELKEWYGACVLYTVRVVRALGPEGLAYLLLMARQDRPLEMSPEVDPQLCADVQRLASGCGVARLLAAKRLSYSEIEHLLEKGILFERTPLGPYPLSPKVPSGWRIDARIAEWGKRLAAAGSSGVSEHSRACRVKKVLEAFRLETIKDMNTLKRLLKLAETDHYCLYRACIFLRQSGNSQVLLEHAKLEGGSSLDVIHVLEDYFSLHGSQGSEGVYD
ncbi:protein Njmu-R1-like [Ischnura elegans]|uniref:protein Njmu-R1-like n=1 Tax=Ischnura elegans TaxID=197161 RepID=UPI001ED8A57C|nr:protein Njmu-R1-like [Ischnura elegans]